jgi:D-alanyl-D-alanine carboxypeptidase
VDGTRGPLREADSARLDKLLERVVERNRNARHGLAAVAKVDGLWSWYGANGILDPEGTPATTTARYPIASVTKLYTATVALRVVELGKLSLEDRMVDFLSNDVTAGLHVLDGVDHTDEITLEHLLGHTSGLPDYYEEAPSGERSAQTRLLAGEDAPMPFEEVLRVVREDLKPHFPPQPLDAAKPKARYSDTNYQLVGAIVEHVSGQPLHRVFDEMLIGPLGLGDTSSYPHPPRSGGSPEPDASVWSKHAVLRPQGALRHQVADGGIISTLSDQVRFMQGLVGGEVFDDPASWQRMQQRWSRIFFPIDYGLGVMRYAPPRWMSPAFRIPPVVGHTGSTATWLFHCPELEIVLAGTFDVAQPQVPFRFLPQVLRAVSKHRPTDIDRVPSG